jgi:hypothetical protein
LHYARPIAVIQAPPREIRGRFPTMTIRASNDALCHLVANRGYGYAAADQRANRSALRSSNVVKLQDADIGFSAIDARVLHKVTHHHFLITVNITDHIRTHELANTLGMQAVVAGRVLIETSPATCLTNTFPLVSEMEFR